MQNNELIIIPKTEKYNEIGKILGGLIKSLGISTYAKNN